MHQDVPHQTFGVPARFAWVRFLVRRLMHRFSVQSMTNTKRCDVAATVGQINQFGRPWAPICVRVGLCPAWEAREAFGEIRSSGYRLPWLPTLHFDYKIALAGCRAGV